jgi:uncharacterized protein with HEPN domain
MRREDRIRLGHMLEAARNAMEFAGDAQREDLDEDKKLVLAFVKCIEIIGEAAGRISAEGRAELPQIPWVDIIATRNRLIHAYFDINLDIVWSTIRRDLPELIAIIERLER